MRQPTINKAALFIAHGKVKRLPSIGGGASVWAVEPLKADGSTYVVTVRGERFQCSCRAGIEGVPCSHGLAAMRTARHS